MHFTIITTRHEIEPKALKAPLAATIRFLYMISISAMVYDRGGQITAHGKFPYSFQEACEFFKVPHVELVKVGRLGQWLNILTQRRRVSFETLSAEGFSICQAFPTTARFC